MAYDLFISYSRRDNEQDRITQLVDRIQLDFAAFAKRDLVPFFDKSEILSMQDWRHRIFQGLRESRLMLACLSPSYLASEYCEWEFVEYLKYEIGHLNGFNGISPIYFVQVPGWGDKEFDQRCAKWVADLRRRQNIDLRPWHEAGEAALRETSVQQRMAELNRQLVQSITRGERAERSLGNIDAHNPHFIGRTANLRQLRENFVTPGHIGVVTAINGIGGLGKTALATEYAHAFADEYGGDRWQVRCADKTDLRLAISELASPIGFEFTEDEKKDLDLQFDRTRRELKKLAAGREPHRCLLFLDNVDHPSLLDPAHVARLDGGDWLHILATTRLGQNELHGAHKDRSFLAVDELPPEDALAVIEGYQPGGQFPSEAERSAAREIVNLLGCFTLAIESAAVYLGQFASDVTCAAFLTRLKREGLEGLDTASTQSTESVLHGEKRLAATLEPTLQRLSPPERLALEFAAILSADHVPLPWLRALAAETFPDLAKDAELGYPDPWKSILRSLFSMRLLQLTDTMDTDGQPLVARIHRVVQETVTASVGADRVRFMQNDIYGLVRWIVRDEALPTGLGSYPRSGKGWEVASVVGTIYHFTSTYPEAAKHLIGIVDAQWEGIRVWPPTCFELLDLDLTFGDSWDTLVRQATLYFKYGFGWHDGTATKRFERALAFALHALARPEPRSGDIFPDDVKQLGWMVKQYRLIELASRFQRLFDQLTHNKASLQLLDPLAAPHRIFISHKRHVDPDHWLAEKLLHDLTDLGYDVFTDRSMAVNADWANAIEHEIRESDVFIPLLSEKYMSSEMVVAEIEIAASAALQYGKPRVLPIQMAEEDDRPNLPWAIEKFLGKMNFINWAGKEHYDRTRDNLVERLRDA